MMTSAQALAACLRVRRSHKVAKSPALIDDGQVRRKGTERHRQNWPVTAVRPLTAGNR